MKLLSQLDIHRNDDVASIQLLQGDLTAIPPEHASDILIISAYPGSYQPYKTTLMAALYDKCLYVKELAKDKEVDLISELGCWLSKPLLEEQQKQFNFKRILCFEPGRSAFEKGSVVGNIFRCINTFAFESHNNVIAMPVVASGNQKRPLAQMVPSILENAIFWLESGLPLKTIKLALYTDEQVEEAFPIFSKIKQEYESVSLKKENESQEDGFAQIAKNIESESPHTTYDDHIQSHTQPRHTPTQHHQPRSTPISTSTTHTTHHSKSINLFKRGFGFFFSKKVKSDSSLEEADTGMIKGEAQPSEKVDNVIIKADAPSEKVEKYDYFISYAHAHSDLIHSFVEKMKLKNNELRIFYDKESIPAGGLWIKQISEAIQKAGKVLVFLSPDYDNSPVCWDEFQCAKLMEYNRRQPVIQTIYLYKYDCEIPPIMGIYSYLDCREGDMEKLLESIPKLVG